MASWKKIKSKNLGEIPTEVSSNLTKPETIPSDQRTTGRTRQLNLKVTEEFYWLLKELALKEKRLMTEIVEKALKDYQKKSKNK